MECGEKFAAPSEGGVPARGTLKVQSAVFEYIHRVLQLLFIRGVFVWLAYLPAKADLTMSTADQKT